MSPTGAAAPSYAVLDSTEPSAEPSDELKPPKLLIGVAANYGEDLVIGEHSPW